jgi:hypothetical protein
VNKKDMKMKNKNGSILVLAVVMVVILLIIGLAMITLGSNARMQAIRSELIISSKTAADTGLAKATRLMKAEYAKNYLTYYPANLGNLNSKVTGALASGTCTGSDPVATYSYGVSYENSTAWSIWGSYDVNSIGTSRTREKKVYAKLVPTNQLFGIGLEHNLIVGNFGDFTATSTLGHPFTIKTNSSATSPPAIQLNKGQTNVSGDIAVGESAANPLAVVDHPEIVQNAGGKVYASENYVYPPVEFPAGWASWPAGPSTGTITTNTNYQYTVLNSSTVPTQNLVIGAVGNPANVIVVVQNQLDLGNSGEIIVNQGSSLSLYITNLTGKNNVTITNKNANPTTLMIYAVGSGEIEFKNNTNIYAGIYAPGATVTFKNMNNNVFQGAMVVDTLQGDKINFIYDAAFDSFNLLGVKPYRLETKRWWEE